MRALAVTLSWSFALAACGHAPPAAPIPPPAPCARASATPTAEPPVAVDPLVAPIHATSDVYFGTEVVDPYRWMEKDSPELAAWMKAQASRTRAVLDAAPVHAELLARLKALDNAAPRVRDVERVKGRVFTLESEPGSNDYRLFVRAGLRGAKRAIVDPAGLANGAPHPAVDFYAPSPDGRHVAFGLSPTGSEMSVLHVVETDTGKFLPDVIDRARYAGVSWLDERSFFYKRNRKLPEDAPANERFIRARVYLHVLGTDPEKDEAVFGYGLSPEVAMTDEAFPYVYVPAGSPYVFASLMHGVEPDLTLYYAPRASVRGATTPWKKLASPVDEVTEFDAHGDALYLLSTHHAARGKILRTSLAKPNLTDAVVVVPESASVLTKLAAAKDALYVRGLDAGIGHVSRVPFDKPGQERVDVGVEGSALGFFADGGEPGILFRVGSWTEAPRMFEVAPSKTTPIPTELVPPSPVVFRDIVSEEVKAPSADGTLVPLSILHRRDLPRDGRSPTHLQGYGAYGSVADPTFEPMRLAWLERGGTIALCHPRGGGELGEAWHRAGKLAQKPNTIEDFLGCARYLVEQKYTSPPYLAGQGTSAGGILIGGAVTRRPDLFGAAVMRVGMVNALRFEQIPIGPFNTGEFGSVATKEGFEMLRAIDAYHHVEAGKPYPAVLLTTGIIDPRVSPWQMGKMAARLGAATSSGKPVLLRIDYAAGHGVGASRAQEEAELADIYTFLLSNLSK